VWCTSVTYTRFATLRKNSDCQAAVVLATSDNVGTEKLAVSTVEATGGLYSYSRGNTCDVPKSLCLLSLDVFRRRLLIVYDIS
jgi:hypothetical protein